MLEKRTKPSLSIVNPLDVLRQRLLLEIARRQMRENSKQVNSSFFFSFSYVASFKWIPKKFGRFNSIKKNIFRILFFVIFIPLYVNKKQAFRLTTWVFFVCHFINEWRIVKSAKVFQIVIFQLIASSLFRFTSQRAKQKDCFEINREFTATHLVSHEHAVSEHSSHFLYTERVNAPKIFKKHTIKWNAM